jgi:hypothetical protein
MRFYTKPHQFYGGIDLHARPMYLCILNQDGEIVLHRNMHAAPEPFLKAVAPYRDGLVVAVECSFTWYWLADLCAQEGIPFVLGHALRHLGEQDWQGLSPMGLLGSGRALFTRQSWGPAVSRPLGEETWQGQGVDHPGS